MGVIMTDTEILGCIYKHFEEIKNFYEIMEEFYRKKCTDDATTKMIIAHAKREMIDELLYVICTLKQG